MSMRQKAKVRRGTVVAIAAVLALALAGCGGDDGGEGKSKNPPSPQSPGAGKQSAAPSNGQSSAPTEILATAKGASGMVLELNSVRRDQGGFLTVNGQIKNTGSQSYNDTATWRGVELNGTGESVAGATLVDKAGKKRYYVLRDTESRCLCTTGVSSVGPGESIPFFAQFPAPPAATTEVDFSLPTFATATVKISG
ncbi:MULTISPECIES: hypothetical protein [unclassified Streptomyces]|uniref:hypothetical protein n=1 Tax=unclassified Streptomyces TaxID=2593676 RepID=UPI002E36B7E8|nr:MULTISPECIES: hypothetical protein [unclassified Streptomyces]WUC64873.1 hypothetical protein OG861_11845 [Streptomyces sp. NBC_00539]